MVLLGCTTTAWSRSEVSHCMSESLISCDGDKANRIILEKILQKTPASDCRGWGLREGFTAKNDEMNQDGHETIFIQKRSAAGVLCWKMEMIYKNGYG